MMGSKCTARLSIISLAFAMGILSGLWMMIFAWYAYWYGHGVVLIAQWSELYTGYAPTIRGGLIGGAWGFLDGFITGAILALVYNFCLCCCRSVCGSSDSCEVRVSKSMKDKK